MVMHTSPICLISIDKGIVQVYTCTPACNDKEYIIRKTISITIIFAALLSFAIGTLVAEGKSSSALDPGWSGREPARPALNGWAATRNLP